MKVLGSSPCAEILKILISVIKDWLYNSISPNNMVHISHTMVCSLWLILRSTNLIAGSSVHKNHHMNDRCASWHMISNVTLFKVCLWLAITHLLSSSHVVSRKHSVLQICPQRRTHLIFHKNTPEGWYGVGGGRAGFRMGNICTPKTDACWCMAKPIQYCKVKNNN